MVEAVEEGPNLFSYKRVQCVGPGFVKYFKSQHSNGEKGTDVTNGEEADELEINLIDDDDEDYLRGLDPKEWKNQDHYAVLGLKNVRNDASANLIKAAYRQKVLKHHPDKRKAKGERVDRDNDYFTCITKAWETLGEPSKRRSYDSVDPYFDDHLPTSTEIAKKDFFHLFNDYFQRNSRWSEKKPVPQLGGPDDTREAVNRFYSFWYNFNSWREYSYEDEEDKETGQVREERRWIEKQNKAVRLKKKKEEMTRLRTLVDLAYENDPRIVAFKQSDKDKKESIKRAKAEAARKKAEEELRGQREAAEREAALREEAKKAEEARLKALKSEREALKRALKKSKKTLRDICRANNYFINSDSDLVRHMEFSEKLCEMLSVNELNDLVAQLNEKGAQVFTERLRMDELRVQQELQKMVSFNKQINGNSCNETFQWSQSEINLLIKAVNVYPAGTHLRWDVVAQFINEHAKDPVKTNITAKEARSKAKELQTSDTFNSQLKEAANQKAYDNFEKEKKTSSVGAEASQRFETVAEQQGVSLPWTAEEQKLLEQALKTYPVSVDDRWEKIAGSVPSRTKKECMKRYKDLVTMIKAKKEAEKSSSNKKN